jgi:hypothetical protein
MMSALALASGLFVGVVLKKAIELVLEKEYATWAPALARLLVEIAGFMCRPRREQWAADLAYVQRVEGTSGIVQAGSCFLSCWLLSLRHGGGVVLRAGIKEPRSLLLPSFAILAVGMVVAFVVSVFTLGSDASRAYRP